MATTAFQFIINELKESLGCSVSLHKNWPGPLPRSSGKWAIRCNDETILFERSVDFSVYEKEFTKLVIKSFNSLKKTMRSHGVKHQYLQTAITASVFDIAISRYIASSRDQFLNIHTLIQYFKRLSFERYEGEQVKTGMIVRKSKFSNSGDVDIESMTYARVPFLSSIRGYSRVTGGYCIF